jgi:pimeloyl-ACP methyl ester carboxylesterase
LATLKIDDIHMHYEVHGSGEPFFLHHGLTSSSQMWHQHLPWLTDKYQVIIHDARGHGLSTTPEGDEHYSWEIFADDWNRLMEHLGIERAIVGGLSMGGGVSHAFALKYPQKVKALILSDSAGTGVPNPAMQVPLEDMDRQMEAREYIVRKFGVIEQAYRSIAAGMARKPVIEDPERYELDYLQRMAMFSVNGSIYATRFVMRTTVPGIERTLGLTMPTLIIIGEEDGLLPAAEWLRDTIPNRRYTLLTKVGHATSRYKPEAWRQAVDKFLNDLKADKNIKGEYTY